LTEGHLSRRGLLVGTASILALNACAGVKIPPIPLVAKSTDLDGLPYNPVAFHLDLCNLSYQLYAQSLVWPFDPYYERHGDEFDREAFMDGVRTWVASISLNDPKPAFAGYRGPGALAGFENNQLHDPVLFRYDTLRPWQKALSLPDENWVEQQAPMDITEKISDVFMCYRPTGLPADTTKIDRVARGSAFAATRARDQLIAFEGETGDKGEPGQPGSQSMMGFVLKRLIAGSSDYDVHIVFRGSRSGVVLRAARQALSQTNARGNPDWITDLGYDFVEAADISQVGTLHRGMVQSVRSMLPKIVRCLLHITEGANGRLPRRISLTGHSLGGGLALQFASTVLMGNRLGPDGQGPDMPMALHDWPWDRLKLVTFGGPVSGDEQWAKLLTSEKLQSRFFQTSALGISLTDPDGLPVNDPEIMSRLTDRTRPVAYRVLNPADPITTLHILGGKHVGQTVYIAPTSPFIIADPNAHEPFDIRNLIEGALEDPAIPEAIWSYRELTEISPGSNPSDAGSSVEFDKLYDAITTYYESNAIAFDQGRFKNDFALYQGVLSNA
jgi:hypothetical protein